MPFDAIETLRPTPDRRDVFRRVLFAVPVNVDISCCKYDFFIQFAP